MSLVVTESITEDIARLTLNRPDKLNALSTDLKREIIESVRALNTEYTVVIIEGAGDSFAAGADLDEAKERDPDDSGTTPHYSQDMTRAVMEFQGAVIGKLHGWVIGAGFEWTLGFDLRYAAEGTTFRMPETQLGLTVSNASTKLLPLTIGPTKAREIVFTSRDVDAEEALEWGLLAGVFPEHELAEQVESVARDIAENASQSALWSNKRGFNHALEVEEALQHESLLRELHGAKNESIDWD